MSITEHELDAFTRGAKRHLDAFLDPHARPVTRPRVGPPRQGIRVRLAVRRHRLAADQEFAHESPSISRLVARMEAEKAARQAGWPIVGYVIDYETQ